MKDGEGETANSDCGPNDGVSYSSINWSATATGPLGNIIEDVHVVPA